MVNYFIAYSKFLCLFAFSLRSGNCSQVRYGGDCFVLFAGIRSLYAVRLSACYIPSIALRAMEARQEICDVSYNIFRGCTRS